MKYLILATVTVFFGFSRGTPAENQPLLYVSNRMANEIEVIAFLDQNNSGELLRYQQLIGAHTNMMKATDGVLFKDQSGKDLQGKDRFIAIAISLEGKAIGAAQLDYQYVKGAQLYVLVDHEGKVSLNEAK